MNDIKFLISRYIDNDLSEEERIHVEALIVRDDKVKQIYEEYSEVEKSGEQYYRSIETDLELPTFIPLKKTFTKNGIKSISIGRTVMKYAAVILLFILVAISYRESLESKKQIELKIKSFIDNYSEKSMFIKTSHRNEILGNEKLMEDLFAPYFNIDKN